MVIENQTGFLVASEDVAGLAGAIEKIISDRSLGRRLGEAGYERAQTLFSIDKNVRQLRALLNPKA
jgi:glycosyltransferase involved in cell wall biosynthesis